MYPFVSSTATSVVLAHAGAAENSSSGAPEWSSAAMAGATEKASAARTSRPMARAARRPARGEQRGARRFGAMKVVLERLTRSLLLRSAMAAGRMAVVLAMLLSGCIALHAFAVTLDKA